jgi:hypothetical protein
MLMRVPCSTGLVVYVSLPSPTGGEGMGIPVPTPNIEIKKGLKELNHLQCIAFFSVGVMVLR